MSIRRHRRGLVEILVLDRPEKRNAMDLAMVEGIGRAVREVEADREVTVLVVTGAGTVFCAGMDLNWVAEPAADVSRDVEDFRRFLRHGSAKPVVAALNGTAVAGGFELMLACDLVVAADHAELGLPEVRRGLIAGGGGTMLPRRIPRAVAHELGLTGASITAARAHEIGLVNRVVLGPDVLDTAVRLAETIARNSPGAVRVTKQLMDQAQELTSGEAWTQVRAAVVDTLASADAREGARAFLERRDPVWTLPAD